MSTALDKAKTQMVDLRSTLTNVRAEKKAAPMAGSMKALAGTQLGAATVGGLRAATDTDFPFEVLIAGGAIAGGYFTNSPFLVGAGGGALAPFLADYVEDKVGALLEKRKANKAAAA